MKKIPLSLAALLLYLGIASLYFGMGVLPHLSTRLAGFENDPLLFTWIFSWWAFAMTHGLNPLWSTYVWAPHGMSIANMTAIPSLAIPLIPLTKLFGALVSYNLCAIYLSALSAWSAYFLCRHLTKQFFAALVGGMLFGFSTYQIGQELGGHLNLLATGLLPLFVLLIMKWVEDLLSTKRFILWFTLCMVIQLGLSRELLLTSTISGVLTWLWGYYLYPDFRVKLRLLALRILLCFIIAMIITSPYWVTFITHMPTLSYPPPYEQLGVTTQPLNFIVPTPITGVNLPALSHQYWHWFYVFYAYQIENGSYIGLPLFVLFLWHTIRHWKQTGKLYLPLFLLCAILSLGWTFTWGRTLYTHILLPGSLLYFVPLLSKVLLIRLSVFLWLLLAIVTAIWLASPSKYKILKWLWVGLSMVCIAPSFSFAHRPWYQKGAYQTQIPATGIITAFAYPDLALPMLWQLNSHFRFKLTMAYTGTYPKDQDAAWSYLIAGKPLPPLEKKQLLVQLGKTDLWGDIGGINQIKQNLVKAPIKAHLVE